MAFFVPIILCLFFMCPSKAGLFTNDRESLKDLVLRQKWGEVLDFLPKIQNQEIDQSQKDLLLIVESTAYSRQNRLMDALRSLQSIKENSIYYSWAQLFLARTGYLSHNNILLEESLKNLKDVKLKGEFHVEKAFYEGYLLTERNKWKAAEKTFRKIENISRGTDLHVPILMARAQTESFTLPASAVCKTLKKIYIQDPLHPWFEGAAPQIIDVPVGVKKYSCLVSEDEFAKRKRNLNLQNEFTRVNQELNKWNQIHLVSVKEQKIADAQQKMAEGHPDLAVQTLKEIKDTPADPSVLTPLSFAAARMGDLKLAIETTLTIQKLVPQGGRTSTMALYQAAVWSYQMGDYDQAELLFKRISAGRLSSAYRKEVQWYKGWLRYLKKDYVAAEFVFRSMQNHRNRKRQKETSDRLVYWLAMSLLKQNKTEKARVLFQNLARNRGINYYSFLSKERLNKIPLSKKRGIASVEGEEPMVNILTWNYYSTPFYNWAPRPPEKEFETADEVMANGVDDESNLIADEGNPEGELDKSNVADGETDTVTAAIEGDLFSNVEANQKLERAKGFWSVGLEDLARREVSDLERYSREPELRKRLMEEYRKLGLFNKLSILASGDVSRANWSSHRFIYESIYPQAYSEFVYKYATAHNVQPALIWGIMKAESMYRPWVKSPVGAMGLMQVMPFTGQKLAEKMDEKKFVPESLLIPEQAIRYGSKYLERMANKFEFSVQLIAAAYNAGPHRVSQWLYFFGYMDMDEWVEHIPFLETRNYVKRVTMNYAAYGLLYGKNVIKGSLNLIGHVPVQVEGAPDAKEIWD